MIPAALLEKGHIFISCGSDSLLYRSCVFLTRSFIDSIVLFFGPPDRDCFDVGGSPTKSDACETAPI